MDARTRHEPSESELLDDEELDAVSGGAGVAHEAAHVTQQQGSLGATSSATGAAVGSNQTLTVGGVRTRSVGSGE